MKILLYSPLYTHNVCMCTQLHILLHTIFEIMGHAMNTVSIISLNFTGMVTYAHLQAILWMGTKFINSNVSIFSHTVADAPNQS